MCVCVYVYIHTKQITNKDLMYSTENYTQYLVVIYNGKECFIYMYNNHFAVLLKHSKSTILQ